MLCVCVLLGSEASFTVAVKQLERYPVDLYYLVDVSASMQENLNHVGVDSQRCTLLLIFILNKCKSFFYLQVFPSVLFHLL